MATKEEIDYLHIIPQKCDCCGEMVKSVYRKHKKVWFNKYLKPDEGQVCANCLKDREGYAEEFLEIYKMPMGEYLL